MLLKSKHFLDANTPFRGGSDYIGSHNGLNLLGYGYIEKFKKI